MFLVSPIRAKCTLISLITLTIPFEAPLYVIFSVPLFIYPFRVRLYVLLLFLAYVISILRE
jgi:hypothetical protein